MIRVIYRFSLVPGVGEEFVQCWEQATDYIQRLSPGARGSILLRGDRSPDEYVAVARWESRALWLASRRSDRNVTPAPLSARFKALLARDTEHEIFDELIDFPPAADNAPSL